MDILSILNWHFMASYLVDLDGDPVHVLLACVQDGAVEGDDLTGDVAHLGNGEVDGELARLVEEPADLLLVRNSGRILKCIESISRSCCHSLELIKLLWRWGQC